MSAGPLRQPAARFCAVAPLLVAPLLLVVWILWPLVPFEHAWSDVASATLRAYALFFTARALAWLVMRSRAAPGAKAVEFGLVFAFAALVSLAVGVGMAAATDPGGAWIRAADLRAAAGDGFWCAVAVALSSLRWRSRVGGITGA